MFGHFTTLCMKGLIAFEKMLLKFSAFLASFVKILSLSMIVIFSEKLVFSEKKGLSFPSILSAISLSLKISTYLLIPYIRRCC